MVAAERLAATVWSERGRALSRMRRMRDVDGSCDRGRWCRDAIARLPARRLHFSRFRRSCRVGAVKVAGLALLLSLLMGSDWRADLPITVCRYGVIVIYDTTDGLMLVQLGPQVASDSFHVPIFPHLVTCSRVAVRDSAPQLPRS